MASRYRASLTRTHHFAIRLKAGGLRDIPVPDRLRATVPVVPGGLAPNATWHALVCSPRAEHKAFHELRRLGFVVYLPVQSVWRRDEKRRVRREVEQVVFPRYLFVCDARQGHQDGSGLPWTFIRAVDGVSGVVAVQGLPLPIRGHHIARLIEQQRGGWGETEEAQLPFEVGSRVRITSGPFSGSPGTVAEIGDETARVEVEIFGRATPVEVAHEAVEVVA